MTHLESLYSTDKTIKNLMKIHEKEKESFKEKVNEISQPYGFTLVTVYEHFSSTDLFNNKKLKTKENGFEFLFQKGVAQYVRAYLIFEELDKKKMKKKYFIDNMNSREGFSPSDLRKLGKIMNEVIDLK